MRCLTNSAHCGRATTAGPAVDLLLHANLLAPKLAGRQGAPADAQRDEARDAMARGARQKTQCRWSGGGVEVDHVTREQINVSSPPKNDHRGLTTHTEQEAGAHFYHSRDNLVARPHTSERRDRHQSSGPSRTAGGAALAAVRGGLHPLHLCGS